LYKFLKCGYIENDTFYKSEKGIPQGSCLSSVLCNMTLDGLESIIDNMSNPHLKMVRYADDILIFADTAEYLVLDVLPVIKKFLSLRGLSLADEKTKCIPLSQGFDFLGYRIVFSYKKQVVFPINERLNRYYNNIANVILSEPYAYVYDVYKKIAPRIRGWINYYIGLVPSYVLYDLEYETNILCTSLTGNSVLAELLNNKLYSKLCY